MLDQQGMTYICFIGERLERLFILFNVINFKCKIIVIIKRLV